MKNCQKPKWSDSEDATPKPLDLSKRILRCPRFRFLIASVAARFRGLSSEPHGWHKFSSLRSGWSSAACPAHACVAHPRIMKRRPAECRNHPIAAADVEVTVSRQILLYTS